MLALGAMVDAAHHLAVPGLAAEGAGEAGHLVTLAGMLAIAVATVKAGLKRRR